MKEQAHHDAVLENLGEYKRPRKILCVIVTEVTTTDDDSESNTSSSELNTFTMELCVFKAIARIKDSPRYLLRS